MCCSIDENYEWFKNNLNELVKFYDNSYIVIKNKNIIGNYSKFAEAYHETIKSEKLGTFIIQLCSLDENKTTATIYTPNLITIPEENRNIIFVKEINNNET